MKPGAEAVCLGRHGSQRLLTQDEVNRRIVAAAQSGKTVVRLKSGDPAIFARAAEEIDCLTAAGIAFEVVPGITAALAAGSYAGIPVTHRDIASAVALVTGHEQHEKKASALDYSALASFPGTLVFYMGVTSAPAWTQALLSAGKRADTPVAILRRCSWPDQSTVRCRLDQVADEVAARRIRPPVLFIVGDVARLEATTSWFTSRPLFGRRVLVTRPASQAESLCRRLEDLGADVLMQPAIEIAEPGDWRPVDEALAQLDRYDWLVFSSANGVQFLLERLCQRHGDLRRFGSGQAGGDRPRHQRRLGRLASPRRSCPGGIPRRGAGRSLGGRRWRAPLPAGSRQPWTRDSGRATAGTPADGLTKSWSTAAST